MLLVSSNRNIGQLNYRLNLLSRLVLSDVSDVILMFGFDDMKRSKNKLALYYTKNDMAT